MPTARLQAHARRLFLASLVYLPVFFGCLLLHQRRHPVELNVPAAAEEANWAEELYEETRDRLRTKGRWAPHGSIASCPSRECD